MRSTRPEATTRVHVVNDVLGTRKIIDVPGTDSEVGMRLVEQYGSVQHLEDLEEPLSIAVFIRLDSITIHFHTWGDERKAREACEAIIAKGRCGP